MSDQQPDPLAFLASHPELLDSLSKLADFNPDQPSPTKSPRSQGHGHYYQETYALWAKKILDTLHENKQPLKVTIEGQSKHTIRLHFYQGAEYLRDNLDPTGVYKELSRNTKCDATGPDYLLFSVRHARRASNPTSVSIQPWRADLTEFIEKSVHGEKFVRSELLLSESELIWIEAQLCGVQELFANKSHSQGILLIRFDEDKL